MDRDVLDRIASSVASSYRAYFAGAKPNPALDIAADDISDILPVPLHRMVFIRTVVMLMTRIDFKDDDEPGGREGHLAPPLYYWIDERERLDADMVCAVMRQMSAEDRHVILLAPDHGFRQSILSAHACMGISIIRSLEMAALVDVGVIADLAQRGVALSRCVLRGSTADQTLASDPGWTFRPVARNPCDGRQDRGIYSLALSVH